MCRPELPESAAFQVLVRVVSGSSNLRAFDLTL